MIKKLLIFVIGFFCSMQIFAQMTKKQMHKQFIKHLQKEKVNILYKAYGKVSKEDTAYEQALYLRNEYGWLLGKTNELKEDIPKFLLTSKYLEDRAYIKTIGLRECPPSEWARYYTMASEFQMFFSLDSGIEKKMQFVKFGLSLLAKEDSLIMVNSPSVLANCSSHDDYYYELLWQYSTAMVRTGKKTEALAMLKKGWKESGDFQFFQSMVRWYSREKQYDSVINCINNEMHMDSSGILNYFLMEAYWNKKDTLSAVKYGKLFDTAVELNDYTPYAEVRGKAIFYTISADQLEMLADILLGTNYKRACTLYHTALTILENDPYKEVSMEKTELGYITTSAQKKHANQIKQKQKEEEIIKRRLKDKIKSCRN